MNIILERTEYNELKKEIRFIESTSNQSLEPIIKDLSNVVDIVDVETTGDVCIVIDPLISKSFFGVIRGLIIALRAFGVNYSKFCIPELHRFESNISLISSERDKMFDKYNNEINFDEQSNDTPMFSKYMNKLFKLMSEESKGCEKDESVDK